MITDKDIVKLKEVFATKEDLEKLDLKTASSFAENEKRFSKIDATLAEHDKKFTKIDKDIATLKKDVSEIKDHLLTMEDNILGAINKLQNENAITSTYRPKLENHEQRISKLETVVLSN